MVVPDCDMGADGTFIFGDSGLEQNPDPEKLANIALSSAESFRTLTGKEPVCWEKVFPSIWLHKVQKWSYSTAVKKLVKHW